MLTAALVIGALLAVAAVWFVARPFLGRETDALPAEPPPERLALEEERDRALAALKELEFDHRTGRSPTTITAAWSAICAGTLRRL